MEWIAALADWVAVLVIIGGFLALSFAGFCVFVWILSSLFTPSKTNHDDPYLEYLASLPPHVRQRAFAEPDEPVEDEPVESVPSGEPWQDEAYVYDAEEVHDQDWDDHDVDRGETR